MTKTIFTPAYRELILWLHNERKSQNLTMRDLAKKLRVPHSYVGRIETRERRLDVLEFIEYCNALNLDPKDGIDILIKNLEEDD